MRTNDQSGICFSNAQGMKPTINGNQLNFGMNSKVDLNHLPSLRWRSTTNLIIAKMIFALNECLLLFYLVKFG